MNGRNKQRGGTEGQKAECSNRVDTVTEGSRRWVRAVADTEHCILPRSSSPIGELVAIYWRTVNPSISTVDTEPRQQPTRRLSNSLGVVCGRVAVQTLYWSAGISIDKVAQCGAVVSG